MVRPAVLQLLNSINSRRPSSTQPLDYLAANPLGRALYAPLFDSREQPPNAARFTFLDPVAQEFSVDWEKAANELVANLRGLAGANPYDRALSDLIGELSTRSEPFRTWWAAHNVRRHQTGTKRLHHPVVGPLELSYEVMELTADTGNTELLARMIRRRVRCDVHRTRAAEPYSDDHDATVARPVREQGADARPDVAAPLRSIAHDDMIILASPPWNVRPAMVMRTFAENLDFAGKTVLPVTTHAVSGIGAAPDEHADACEDATIGRSLALRGERVRDAGDDIDAWVRRARLPRPR